MKKPLAVKIGLVSLGCPKNQVDAEMMLANLKGHGFALMEDPYGADIVIVNTCGFIEDAKRESIDAILEFCAAKKEGDIRAVVVTGCLAQRYQQELIKEIPETDMVLGIGADGDLVSLLEQFLTQRERVDSFPQREELPLEGERVLTNYPYYAYLKIAEGCDNCCSYCVIPQIRGRYRSRPMESILEEARSLAADGVKELILVAQDTTRYGDDLYGELMLPKLLGKLCEIDGLRWIRILYCYPDKITDELLDVMAKQEKIAKYMDLPLQHADAGVLKRMNRTGDEKSLLELVEHIRERVPHIILRTTFITGFPGEGVDEFEVLARFVKEARFDHVGCFAYSAEEGTPAHRMPAQVEEAVKQSRADLIMTEQARIVDEKNAGRIGSELTVVVEGTDESGECFVGRSAMSAPDIDPKVLFTSDQPLDVGAFVTVSVDGALDLDLTGTMIERQGGQ